MAFLFAFASSHAASAAGTIYSVSRDSMTVMLTAMEMKVVDRSEADKEPWLVVTAKDGTVFNVFLYQCDGKPTNPAAQCEQVQFRILWDNTKGRTAEDVNRFHLEKVFGKGYVSADRKDIGLEYPLHLKYGVSEANLRENVGYFLEVVEDFVSIVKPY